MDQFNKTRSKKPQLFSPLIKSNPTNSHIMKNSPSHVNKSDSKNSLAQKSTNTTNKPPGEVNICSSPSANSITVASAVSAASAPAVVIPVNDVNVVTDSLLDQPNLPSQTELLLKLKEQGESILGRLSTLELNLTSRMDNIETNMSNKIDKLSRDLINLEERVKQLENNCTEIVEIREKVNNTASNVDRLQLASIDDNETEHIHTEIGSLKLQIQTIAINNIAADAILIGIPYTPNEQLKNTFNLICHCINYQPPHISAIFRSKVKTNSVIIIKFLSATDKIKTIKALSDFRKLSSRNLSLNDIDPNLNSDTPIFIHESLTTENREILRTAIDMKRKRLIYAAFTMRGLVNILISKNEGAICIRSLPELNEIASARLSNNISDLES